MNAAPVPGRDGRYGLIVALDERDLARLREGRLLVWNGPDALCSFQVMYADGSGELAPIADDLQLA